MDIYKVPTCCSCHIMGYSYVYPPLKPSLSGKTGEPVEPLPTSPASNSKPASLLNPQKEFQSFLDNIGNFAGNIGSFAGRPGAGSDMSSKPSVNVQQRVRKRPGLRRPGNQKRHHHPNKMLPRYVEKARDSV